MPALSIVVPCYNEALNIPYIFEKLGEIEKENPDVEVILVDNGSTDNSRDVFAQYALQYPQIIVHHIEKNEGYGNGILQGLSVAKGEYLSWTHADQQTDPKDVITAYNLIKGKTNVVVKGKRKARALVDAFFTFGMQLFSFCVLKVYLDDINAQPKVFSVDFYNRLLKGKAPLDFSLDLFLLYTAKKAGYTILEVPVYYKKRLYGEAKGGGSLKGKAKLTKRTIDYIFKLRAAVEV